MLSSVCLLRSQSHFLLLDTCCLSESPWEMTVALANFSVSPLLSQMLLLGCSPLKKVSKAISVGCSWWHAVREVLEFCYPLAGFSSTTPSQQHNCVLSHNQYCSHRSFPHPSDFILNHPPEGSAPVAVLKYSILCIWTLAELTCDYICQSSPSPSPFTEG